MQNINIGNFANDGTGDDLREAFIKVNQNFQELELGQVTATNLGSAGIDVFAQKVDNTLQFRRLLPGNNIFITQDLNTIRFDCSINFSFVIITPDGSLHVNDGNTLTFFADEGIKITGSENTKSVSIGLTDSVLEKLEIVEQLSSFDFGDFDTNVTSIIDFYKKSLSVDMGTIDVPSIYNIDLGSFNG